jgi:uncharacterized protein (TIGR02145 family)
MKSNPIILLIFIYCAILALFVSGCQKDNPENVTDPVVLYNIDDYGYTYAVCKGTFNHNNDTSLLLKQIYYSDSTGLPTATNGSLPRISLGGHGYIYTLKDTLGQLDFECTLIELQNNTTYHVRCAYTKDRTDTLYSNVITFTTKPFEINSIEFNPDLTYGQVSDIEGNTYNTIAIGTQTWMAENLKTTKFNDGTSISLIDNIPDFLAAIHPAYCNFENNEILSEPLGKLYNWYVVEEGNVCPEGWRVATSSDWDILDEFVWENYQCRGKALASREGWMEAFWFYCNVGNNFEPNDSTGFSAIAAGEFSNNIFRSLGHAGVWWSPDDQNGNYLPSSRYLTRDNSSMGLNSTETENKGYSIRCIKD